MAGLGLAIDIAKTALSAQASGIDVTAHNIANVNTEGYSRQRPVQQAAIGVFTGLQLGRGVDTATISRVSDKFVETQLMKQKSSYFYSEEMERYMKVLEGAFNEDTDASLSNTLSEFWNLWHDISNNPSGSSERGAIYEHGILLSEQFKTMDDNLRMLDNSLTRSISSGIDEINQITGMIGQLNTQIVATESDSTANDMRDQRGVLLRELSEYIDANIFEQSNGTVTAVTARGCVIVQGASGYDLELGGSNGDRVEWQSSGGANVDITDSISAGKMGGWLDMRDEILAKYKLDFDELAKEFVWTVNSQHSQGVGLKAFSTVTGDFAASSSSDAVGASASGLAYRDKIVDGSFEVRLYDENGALSATGGTTTITIDASVTTADGIATLIDGIHANISATVTDGKLVISGSNSYTFAFSGDTSNALAALGVNTFFEGVNAGGLGVSDTISADRDFIAAAQIETDGTFALGDNRNARAIADLQYSTIAIPQHTVDRSGPDTEGSVTASIESYYHGMVGSIGIAAANISNNKTFNQVMVNKLSEIRNSVSAVSLDEEMTNLMKYQHAYTAAAKLLQAADELLSTLLNVL